MATASIIGNIYNSAGSAVASAAYSIKRITSPDLDGVANSTDPVTGTTDANGAISASVYRNTSFPIAYRITFPSKSFAVFTVQPADATVNMGRILDLAPYQRDLSSTVQANIALSQPFSVVAGTVATTGANTVKIASPGGILASVQFVSGTALSTSDTNYLTFTTVNVTNTNAAMLAATNAETTKATGGSALTANTPRTLALSGTAANLVTSKGDVISLVATATGTLAGALSNAYWVLTFTN